MALEHSSSEIIKLKMLSDSFMPEWATAFGDQMRQKFEEIYHNVVVDLRYTHYDGLYDKIITAMKGGNTGYDIFPVDNIWIPEFVEASWLTEVTEHMTDEIKNSIFPEALKAAEYPANSGKYYALPWYMDAKYLFYNKAMLKKAGFDEPPKTLDELWEQAVIIKKKGIVKYPFVWSWAQQECLICDYIILTTLFGGRFVDENGKPAFQEGGAVTALEWMCKSIDAGLTSWASLAFAELDVSRVFAAGDAAFTLLWLSSYENMSDPKLLAGSCGITHVPGSDILPEGISVNGSMLLGISPNCKNKDLAVELAKFWAGLGLGRSYVRWLFPTWMRLFDTPKIFLEGIYNIMDVVNHQYSHLVNRPRIPRYTALSRELQRTIHEALSKVKNPREALNDAAKRFMSR